MKIDIESLKRKLLIKYPAFGVITSNLNYIEDNNITETAATDNENVYYNSEFINKLDEEELLFVFAHEIAHIALNHIIRSEGKDQELWNIATDAVINAHLKQDGLKMVKSGVDIADAINYDSEDLYNKLLDEKQNNNNNTLSNNDPNQQKNKTSLDNKKENQNVGHDSHELWRRAINRNKENQEQKQNMDKNSKVSEQNAFERNKKEKRKKLKELMDSLAEQSHGVRSSINEEYRSVSDIGMASPLIDWRRLLQEAIKYEVDWTYRNAYVEDYVVTPTLEEILQPETEIILDTSGSIDESLLKNFLRECKNILQTSKVKVGCFDTKFYGFHEIKNLSDIDRIPLMGGGGTDFNVAVNAFSKRVENKIIFTDGESSEPRIPLNAIWIVFGTRKINPPGGKVIYISKEQLRNLYSSNSYQPSRRSR